MDDKIQSFKKFLFSKRGFSLVALLFAAFILFSIVRGCRNSSLPYTTYHIGLDDRWASLNLVGREKIMTAFSNDVLRAIAKEQSFGYTLSFFPPDQLLARLDNGQLQGILSAIAPTSSLEKRYLFSEPYFLYGPVLIVPKISEFDTWEEAPHKVIGILSSSASIFEMSQEQSIQLRLYENPLKALADLDGELIDGVILPALQAYIYTQTFYPGDFRIATTPLTKEGYRLMALHNETGKNLIERFNDGLKKLKADGEYQKLVERWGFINPEKISE